MFGFQFVPTLACDNIFLYGLLMVWCVHSLHLTFFDNLFCDPSIIYKY